LEYLDRPRGGNVLPAAARGASFPFRLDFSPHNKSPMPRAWSMLGGQAQRCGGIFVFFLRLRFKDPDTDSTAWFVGILEVKTPFLFNSRWVGNEFSFPPFFVSPSSSPLHQLRPKFHGSWCFQTSQHQRRKKFVLTWWRTKAFFLGIGPRPSSLVGGC